MDEQRLAVRGIVVSVDDPRLQDLLEAVHDTPDRPRCLCVPGGVEMYVARHSRFVVKRMPDTAARHHVSCPSFETEGHQSGLGQLMGDAVLERQGGDVEVKVDFPWTRVAGRSTGRHPPADAAQVERVRRRLSLRGLAHLLLERAGFNRWSPAMEGKRNQAVLQKYLLEAADGIVVKGLPLETRLYVPEPFAESSRAQVAQRRRDKLSVLLSMDGRSPLAIVMGEFKGVEPAVAGMRVWIKHMPDTPLLVDGKTWKRITRAYGSALEARDADGGREIRVVITALILARRERTYEIDTANLMLTSRDWIPLEGVHELALIQKLVGSRRRFLKPLRYEAETAGAFANALLLDAGPQPVPLHVNSPFVTATEREAKTRLLDAASGTQWVWEAGQDMPELPPVSRQSCRGR